MKRHKKLFCGADCRLQTDVLFFPWRVRPREKCTFYKEMLIFISSITSDPSHRLSCSSRRVLVDCDNTKTYGGPYEIYRGSHMLVVHSQHLPPVFILPRSILLNPGL